MDAAIAGPLHGLFAFSGGEAGFVRGHQQTPAVQDAWPDAGADGFYRERTPLGRRTTSTPTR